MIRFKEIRLYPTLHFLDVYVVDSENDNYEITEEDRVKLSEKMSKRYGDNVSYWYENTTRVNEVWRVDGGKDSEIGNTIRFVITIKPFEVVLIHEIQHVLQYLSKQTGVETNYDSQEWQACFVEYLFTEIREFDKIPEMK